MFAQNNMEEKIDIVEKTMEKLDKKYIKKYMNSIK